MNIKKIGFVLLIVLMGAMSSVTVHAENHLVFNAPHFKVLKSKHVYEYNLNLNPDKYGWCGHGAFSSALSVLNINKDIKTLHNDFSKNDPYNYYSRNCGNSYPTGRYCASTSIMEKTALKYKSQGNNIYNIVNSYSHNKDDFFEYIKSQIGYSEPVVVRSIRYKNSRNVWKNIGHFYTVVGYYENNGSKYIFVRDPLMEKGGWLIDKIFTLNDFWNNANDKNKVATLTIGD